MTKLEELTKQYAELSTQIIDETHAEIRRLVRQEFPDAMGIQVEGEDMEGLVGLMMAAVILPDAVLDTDDPRVESLAEEAVGSILDWLTVDNEGSNWWGTTTILFKDGGGA